MIIVDTSAIIAIIKREAGSDRLIARLQTERTRQMAAATYVEAGTVLAHLRRGQDVDVVRELDRMLAGLGVKVVPLDEEQARVGLRGRILYGQGFGTGGGINFGDSFAYALAKVRGAPLLFVGDDFSKTDIEPALP